MTVLSSITGTFYFFYYLTFGYFLNYQKHLLLRQKCSEQWHKKETSEEDKKYLEDLYGKK